VEILVIVGVMLALGLALLLLALVIRAILLKIAKHNGFTGDSMPIHYHMFAFGVYFTIVILVHLAYLTSVGS
jgi:ABC-type antimicrobial peptide transport system permease subunit